MQERNDMVGNFVVGVRVRPSDVAHELMRYEMCDTHDTSG